MTRAMTIAVSMAALAALAACGGTSTNSGGGGSGASVSTGSAGGNTVLTNSAARTLYYLTSEQGGHDACTSVPGCAGTWPAVAPPSGGSPTVGSGVTGTLAVISASDGTMEVTLNGWPLHSYAGDTGSGQATGEGLMTGSGVWHVATPSMTSSGAGTGTSTSPSSSPTATGYGGAYP
jgi:predicted lipoprotein with Yx(FWY)xxD motif